MMNGPDLVTRWNDKDELMEDLIAKYQKRCYGASSVREGLALSDKFAEACRNSKAIPAWALVVRALAGHIHLLRQNMGYQDNGKEPLMAVLRRQVWVDDDAVDTEPPVEFDATNRFLRMSVATIENFREHDYDSDSLADDIPERIEWTGPFEVDVDIDDWLMKNGIPDGRKNITQEDLDRLRKEYGVT